jgi:hypothetical protein
MEQNANGKLEKKEIQRKGKQKTGERKKSAGECSRKMTRKTL